MKVQSTLGNLSTRFVQQHSIISSRPDIVHGLSRLQYGSLNRTTFRSTCPWVYHGMYRAQNIASCAQTARNGLFHRGGRSVSVARISTASTKIQRNSFVSPPTWQDVLYGICTATKIPEQYYFSTRDLLSQRMAVSIENVFDTNSRGQAQAFDGLASQILSTFKGQDDLQHIATVTLCIMTLQRASHHKWPVPERVLDSIWTFTATALKSKLFSTSMPTPVRSAQGFLAVPICSIIENGNIKLLFRLHLWLPDGERGNPDFGIHSHQPFATSWILTGQGKDIAYQVDKVPSRIQATHSQYALAWTGIHDNAATNAYRTHQMSSTIVNKHEWVRAMPGKESVHSRGTCYSIPAASYHCSEVAADMVHATLFLFDSCGGFVKNAGVLGPIELESSTQIRSTGSTRIDQLITTVETSRDLEEVTANIIHAIQAQSLEDAFKLLPLSFQAYRRAMRYSNSAKARQNYAQAIRMLVRFVNTSHIKSSGHLSLLTKLALELDIDIDIDIPSHPSNDGAVKTSTSSSYMSNCRNGQMKGDAPPMSVIRRRCKRLFRSICDSMSIPARDGGVVAARKIYTDTLANSALDSMIFDTLRYVAFEDFVVLGRIPRFADGVTRSISESQPGCHPHLVFISYRWSSKDPWKLCSDDLNRQLYIRIIDAVERLLQDNSNLNRQDIGIWIDASCIDENDALPGILALPMIIAQCNTLISLLDDSYYDRAWCSLETLLIRTLQKRYKLHSWYEHRAQGTPSGVAVQSSNDSWILRPGNNRPSVEVSSTHKHLSVEDDRSYLLFLEQLVEILD